MDNVRLFPDAHGFPELIFVPAMLVASSVQPLSERCAAVDGDTLRCGRERVRLIGIDAPELPGHCRHGRSCVPGDPIASTASLRYALKGRLRIKRFGKDHYGRTLALVSSDIGDLSCWQVRHKHAIYKPRWDKFARVRHCL